MHHRHAEHQPPSPRRAPLHAWAEGPAQPDVEFIARVAPASHASQVPKESELIHLFAELGLVTSAPPMTDVLRPAWKAAQVSDAPLLIEGATGTGKQVLAQAVHCLDPKRSGHPFVTVHCGTIQPTVAESELFGHARGAFSGAIDERQGLFGAAQHGTVFLDDVGDLPPSLQPKLLDVLQRRVVRRVGSDREHPIDVRVIAASSERLDALVAQGRFRADLFYRLDVIRFRLPLLQERSGDLAALVLALAERHRSIYGPVMDVRPELVQRLAELRFPGNVRELEHLVERMLFLKDEGTVLGLEDWPPEATATEPADIECRCPASAAALVGAIRAGQLSFHDALRRLERALLAAALAAPGQTRRNVAEMLGISERSLYEKLRELHLDRAPRTVPKRTAGHLQVPTAP